MINLLDKALITQNFVVELRHIPGPWITPWTLDYTQNVAQIAPTQICATTPQIFCGGKYNPGAGL